MHRVELKEGQSACRAYRGKLVPNAPCGVERLKFLSYRSSLLRRS